MRPQDSFSCSKALIGFLCVLLTACGGGGSGGSSTSGGGQKPDPVVVDLPIAYIKRPIPLDENKTPVFPEILKPRAFNGGGAIYIKDRATALATPVNITDSAFEKGAIYDVKDLSVHPAGDRLLFAMHAPMLENVDDEDQPTWNIWEYNLKTKHLRRIISSDLIAEEADDISPRYLADGRIVFSSTRQGRSKAILLDDGKPQFSAQNETRNNETTFLLHTMKDDGSDIQQITFNQSHDLYPTPLSDGRILYTHWDASGTDRLSFYTVNPDGTQVERHYGYYSMNQAPAAVQPPAVAQPNLRWFRPQQMSDGRIVAILKPEGALLGGDMVVIDTPHFFENDLATPASGGTATNAQKSISILPINITVGTREISKHGRFAALTPLYDGTQRLLTSWSECRLIEPKSKRLLPCTDEWIKTPLITEAAPLYGIWIYNVEAQTQQPVVLAEEGMIFTEPVSLEPRAAPTFLNSKIEPDLATEGVGLLHIRSVYDMDGSFTNYGFNGAPTTLTGMAEAAPDARPARFIRLIKAVSIPDEMTRDALGDTTYGQLFNQFTNRLEILGYTPVEPDGSVKVKVPADVAFKLEILDKNGRRLGTTQKTWLQLRPGEVRTCNGCHDPRNTTSGHGRSDAELASINTGAATSGAQFPNTLRFDNLGIPVAANMGETMAEFAERSTWCLTAGDPTSCSPYTNKSKGTNLRAPSVDLVFDDEWSVPAAKAPSFAYRYNALADTEADIHAPASAACRENDGWTSLCRIIINYEQHLQPLWERDRPTGACISCHTPTDADGNAQIPSGQLEFARTKTAANRPMLSYTQLLDTRNKKILTDDGTLTDIIPVCEFDVDTDEIPECVVTRDIDGNPTCDGVADCPFARDTITNALLLDSATGNPIPITRNIGIAPPLSRGGARASVRFFNRFIPGGAHASYLNDSELKLLSEWLDIRANYYNNPFDSVEPN